MKKRNPIAPTLRTSRFRKRITRNRKKYDRKKHNARDDKRHLSD